MTAEDLKREAELIFAELGKDGGLCNARREVEAEDHPDGVDLQVGLRLSWDSRLPVVELKLGATFLADADPKACARDLVRGLVELALATVPGVKRFRRRRRGSLSE